MTSARPGPEAPIRSVRVQVFRIPTPTPESDGTFDWDATTLVVVWIDAGGATGLGYTYAASAAATLIESQLAPAIIGTDAFAIPGAWATMVHAVRNVGREGIAATAISAVDTALWDLKARLLGVSLSDLFGAARDSVPIYGSGGFTNYDEPQLRAQIAHFRDDCGCALVKIKIGDGLARDRERLRQATAELDGGALMVDANGAYSPKEALAIGECLAGDGIIWFEEPVSSDDLAGLALLRARMPAPVEIAAGEYAYDPFNADRLLAAGAVDVLQIDATRCLGFTGFLKAAALAEARHIDISSHTAPALHLPVCAALPHCRHIEWFVDHARIEAMLFDGAPKPDGGTIAPDRSRPGHGLTFKAQDAARYRL